MRWIFFLLPLSLIASENEAPWINATMEGEPAACFESCVNAITGRFFVSEPEIVVPGAHPIVIPKLFTGINTDGWEFLPHKRLDQYWSEGNHLVIVRESSGALYKFIPKTTKEEGEFLPDLESNLEGMTNISRGKIGARTNLKNIRLFWNSEEEQYEVFLADGVKRIYKKYESANPGGSHRLVCEKFPNGNLVRYEYVFGSIISSITSYSPTGTVYAWARFHYTNENRFTITTKDQKSYLFVSEQRGGSQEKKIPFLRAVFRSHGPKETIHYGRFRDDEGKLVRGRTLPNGRYIAADYYAEGTNHVGGAKVKVDGKEDPIFHRVSSLKAPVGPDGEEETLYKFFYHIGKYNSKNKFKQDGSTVVYDSSGVREQFQFSKHLREKVIQRTFQDKLLYEIAFSWGAGADTGNLRYKSLRSDGKELLNREYVYDKRGNVLLERTTGLIESFTPTTLTKEYTYTKRDLIATEKHPNGLFITYTYHGKTDLISSRLTLYNDKIIKREFFFYDDDNILVKRIEDDGSRSDSENYYGATVRLITYITPREGFPYIIEERCVDLVSGAEEEVQTTYLTYDHSWQVTSKIVVGSDGRSKKKTHYEYDDWGRLSQHINELGEIFTYKHDDFGNLIEERDPSGLIKTHLYDNANRRIRSEFQLNDEILRTFHYSYDAKSRKTGETDWCGNWIRYTYDGLDNLSHEKSPLGHEKITRYDALSHPIEEIDFNGHATKTLSNMNGDPLEIVRPDGAREEFRYACDGTLRWHKDAEGHTTETAYDHLGRLLTKVYPDGSVESYAYSTYHLLSHTDIHGHTSNFRYDRAGRKIAEERDDLVIYYEYDPFGRLSKTITVGDGLPHRIHETRYDLLDRVIEESDYDEENTIASSVSSGYDAHGNKVRESKLVEGRESIYLTEYDSFDRVISLTDPKGRKTEIAYELFVDEEGAITLKKTTIDPKGRKTIEWHDADNHVALMQKVGIMGYLLQEERYDYDPNGTLIKQLSTVIQPNAPNEYRSIIWEYDSCNRLIVLTEAEERITHYHYSPNGHRIKLVKPDGTTLFTTYDSRGRPNAVVSSDGTIDYEYVYASYDEPLLVTNRITGKTTERELDCKGRIISEKLENGQLFQSFYNAYDQRVSLILPDGTAIDYEYDAFHLRRIRRGVHVHTYDLYDTSFHILEETPLGALPGIKHHYNLMGQEIRRKGPAFQEGYRRLDEVGNLLERGLALGKKRILMRYTYDELDQVTSETGPKKRSYVNDSRSNRREKNGTTYTVDSLNQLLASSEATYTYDESGNPLTKRVGDEVTTYRYDAFGRLIEVKTPERDVTYSYDPFHRRLTKSYDYTEEHYLYDGQNEIGLMWGNVIRQLRVLGLGRGAEIGAAVLVEIGSSTYYPMHTIAGDLVALIDPETGVAHRTRLPTLFGEMRKPPENFWAFQSKRYDPDAGLYFFGRRYYDPKTGRFFTPDPKGFDGVPNLYHFVRNNPTRFIDLYGLESTTLIPSTVKAQIKATFLDTWNNPRFQGGLQAFGGLSEAGFGAGMTYATGGLAAPAGWAVMAHGLDHFFTGMATVLTGRPRDSATSQLLQKTGISHQTASFIDSSLSIGGTMGSAAVIHSSRLATFPNFRLTIQEPQTTLYRAVQPAELADIQTTGIFRNLGNAEGKYFTTSIEGASSYAKKAVTGFGDPPYALVKTQVPNNILNGMSPTFVDGGIPAWVIRDQSLEGLIPEIMTWMAVPK